ncbi:unnamed protein product, partial [Ectocarpus sp. 12 AP-2014]
MFKRFAALCVGAALLTTTPTFADACARSVSKKAASTIVPSSSINQSLLDSAIRDEVNFHRCRAGLGKVGDVGTGLSNQAKKHSQWMAKTQQLTHRSTVAGASTLRDRFKRAGVKFRTGSENIGMVHRYQIDNRRFKILDSGSCKFATYEGKSLPAHSYATLARHVVSLWMDSPGHRKNILDKNVSKVETAVAFDPNAKYCGRFWLT